MGYRVQPMFSMVLIDATPQTEEGQFAGVVYDKWPQNCGVVIGRGEDVRAVKEGQRVLFQRTEGSVLELSPEGKQHVLVNQADILAIISE